MSKIVIALGGNALGNTLPEQAEAVKITSRAIVDLIEAGHQVVVAHGNGPQVGIINNAMSALQKEDPKQGFTPLSVCGAEVSAIFPCAPSLHRWRWIPPIRLLTIPPSPSASS